MTTTQTSMSPPALRARVAADCMPVRPLPAPEVRALAAMPFAMLALLAAPFWFSIREDAPLLGWSGSWGLSLVQALLAVAMLVAALRDAVPGRAWSRPALRIWMGLPLLLVATITWTTWEASAVRVEGPSWRIAAMCFAGSLASSLPLLVMSAALSARAFPIRPGVTGFLGGLGAGLVADAGWRMFCDFSEPAHVLAAHLGGVLAAACLGAILTRVLVRRL